MLFMAVMAEKNSSARLSLNGNNGRNLEIQFFCISFLYESRWHVLQVVFCYFITDDPNEYEDLSSDTNNAAMILQMKLMLTDALRNSYQKPLESFSQPVANLTDPADPGWC